MNEVGATQTVELVIEGMRCDSCVSRVRTALLDQAGIESAEVAQGRVLLEFYPEAATLDDVIARIESLGYTVQRPSRSRNPFRRFLESMAAGNEKAFGHERLDCCTMRMKNR